MKKIHNVFKQLSLIDKLVLVSLALLIISCIFGVLTCLFKDGILNSIFEFLLVLASISSLIGGYIFEERIIFSIILIVISVILQIIALDLYMNTPIGINKIISVINKVIWCCFIYTMVAGNIWFNFMPLL